MLDKPDGKPVIVDGKELAIGAHLQVQLGQTRALDLSVAIPLGWEDADFNGTLDRLVNAANRLKAKQDLEASKSMLMTAELDLSNQRAQRLEKEMEYVAAHNASNKRGEWSATGGQRQALSNLDLNEKNTAERIKTLRKTIAELEEKCR